MLSLVILKIKHFFLFFVNVLRRALCCFRKRRRCSTDSVPLTHVGVIGAEPHEDWKWEENDLAEPKTVQDHIELYRKKKQQMNESPSEAQVDFFGDMAPKITRQTKLYISEDSDEASPNRLGVLETAPVETEGELREWEESRGWEGETLDWDAQNALREKKRQDLERKKWELQQKRMEKINRLGARVGT